MEFRMGRPLIHSLGQTLWMAVAAIMLVAASVSQAAAQHYKVRSGDTLKIEVLEDTSLNRSLLVAPDGRISVPTAGSIRAAGQTIEAIQRVLTNRLNGNYANTPNVFVSLERLFEPRPVTPRQPTPPPMISVYVMGEANTPGKLEVSPGTNVLQMFAVMGGFTNFAAKKRVQLRSTDKKTKVQSVRNLNYKAIEAGGPGGLTVLRDGDIIIIPQRRLFE